MAKSLYPFTENEAANALLARDGTALLIGLCLDQQVRTEKAMIGPYELRKRLGTLDARKIAAMSAARMNKAFRATPALHRFPGMMAKRVRALCALLTQRYGGRGARVWSDAKDADEVFERLRELPGFGQEKAAIGVRILAKLGKHKLAGWKRYASDSGLPWQHVGGKRF